MDHKSSGKDSNLVSTTIINKSPVKNMLLRSVRLIVARSEDSVKMKNHLVKSFILDFDTSRFKKLFDKKLSGTGMKFHIGWKENKTLPDTDKRKRMIYIKAGPGISLPNEPAVMEEYLRLASIETKRLEDLVNRVLDHSLLDEHHHPLELVRTDINKLIREVVDPMQQRLGKSCRIEFHSKVESIFVRADPLYLKGVLINLVDNSIKYCDKEPLINIESGRKDGFAVIEVRDNGPGIPEEYQKKVFEIFFRLPTDDIHNVKGYGLGLSFASLVHY